MTETELIQRAQEGDPLAMRDIYRLHAPRVYAVVKRLAGDEQLAEDWAQEAWVRIFRALGSFRGEARFTTWLHRIAVNSALHGRRWRERRVRHETPMLETTTANAKPENPLLRLRLEQAMQLIPERMRQVLVLHDIEGYTHEEIAEFLGVTAGTSKSQLFKARARMREQLRPASEPVNGEEACLT
ncbi:MAG TPA: sigma-70 family RNA polymerase sigma factor [Hyphomicrobiaceae bacterium]